MRPGAAYRGGQAVPARRSRALRVADPGLRQDVDAHRQRASRRATTFTRSARNRSAPGLLYAGTEHGIYVSFDDGDHWQSLSLNLPDTQVPDLVVEDQDLVIATHGRSFYVLDGIESCGRSRRRSEAPPCTCSCPDRRSGGLARRTSTSS